MLIQKQYNKLILQLILLKNEMQIQQCFSLSEKAKEAILDFSQGTIKVL